MLENISHYKNTKRNDKCPCGSGMIFKNCCMESYREAKKKSSNSGAKISSFSPISQLEKKDKEFFTNFYLELMLYTNQYQYDSDYVTIDDISQNMQEFMSTQRIYFYENKNKIIDKFIADKTPTTQQLEILEALRNGKLDKYFLLSFSKTNVVIYSIEEKLYNARALNSPFDEIFNRNKKYLGIYTALIPYKNGYITDGIYKGFDVSKEVEQYFDNLPYRNPQIIYNPNNTITNIPLVINFVVQASSEKFELMEDIILRNIPKAFAKSFTQLFKNELSHKVQLIASFLRSTDVAKELNCEEGDRIFSNIIGGAPVTNFERNGDDEVILYDILKEYYTQKPLSQSASASVYENIQKNKKSLLKDLQSQASFYTMLGIINIDTDKFDNLIEFLQTFKESQQREKITLGIDNLFDDLSEEAGFEIESVFLGLGINLDCIYYYIEKYRTYVKQHDSFTLNDFKKYGHCEF